MDLVTLEQGLREMTGGVAAPLPPFQTEFSKMAQQFGIDPAQLSQIIAADPELYVRLQQSFIDRARSQASMPPVGYDQQQLRGLVQNFASNPPPNVFIQQPRVPSTEELHEEAMKHMNPIAREKYEPVFKLLGIKARWTGYTRTPNPCWVLQKSARDGKQFRQEWSTPSDDPAGSLALWDAMVGYLLDNIKNYEDANTNHDNRAAGSGQ